MSHTLVITGASAGIGLATAEMFAERGWAVINLSRSAPSLAAVTHIRTDLADPDWPATSGAALSDALVESLGDDGVVCLVHCAGLLLKDRIDDVEAAALRRAMEVNVVAPAVLNQLVLPRMNSGSSILYVGSTLGEKAVPGAASYAISKHALIGLMRATCQDLSGRGVHTACICPGFTDTEMLRAHVGGDEEVLAAIASGVTFNRLIDPEEIAATLAFCADHPVLNGSVIHANLGQIER